MKTTVYAEVRNSNGGLTSYNAVADSPQEALRRLREKLLNQADAYRQAARSCEIAAQELS